MENIIKQRHYQRYMALSLVIIIFLLIYQWVFLEEMMSFFILILLSVYALFSYFFNKTRNKQMDYLIQCCDDIIDQKQFRIIDGETKESLLSHKLLTLNQRYHQTLQSIHQEQLKLKDYIEDITHQLKTPMTSMRINIELLLEQLQNEQLRSIEFQLKRIQTLVNDLQTVALIDSHNIIFDFQNNDLEDMIDGIKEDLSYLKPTIHLHNNMTILCDEKWFVEALENIIKNCMETSNNDIDIIVKESDSTYHIYIEDHGKGIDEKDLPHLFERFYRGKNSQGTGIGLYIAKEIIEAHHGFIRAYNQDGACFEIVVPQFNVKRKI